MSAAARSTPTPATSLAERLALIHRALARLIDDERPAEAAVEETFVNRDPQSALKLGQARGVGAGGAGADGLAGRRIRRQPDQEDGGRRRPRREGAGGDDGQDAAARQPGADRPTPPTRWRWRSATRSTARARGRRGRGMIGKLKGIVDEVDEEELILDVGGVGYLVAASARTLRALPPVGQAAALHIETQVREDAIRLFGFLTVARARLVPPAAERAGRRRQGRARRARRRCRARRSARRSPIRTRRRWRARPASAPSSPRASSTNSRTRRRRFGVADLGGAIAGEAGLETAEGGRGRGAGAGRPRLRPAAGGAAVAARSPRWAPRRRPRR